MKRITLGVRLVLGLGLLLTGGCGGGGGGGGGGGAALPAPANMTILRGNSFQINEHPTYSNLSWHVDFGDAGGNLVDTTVQEADFAVEDGQGNVLTNPFTGQPEAVNDTRRGDESRVDAPLAAQAVAHHCDSVVLHARVVFAAGGSGEGRLVVNPINPGYCG